MNHQCSNLYFRINFIGHAPLPWISPANTTIEAPKNVPIAFVILISEYSLQCFGSKWQSSSSRKRRDARPPAKNDRPRQPECKVMVLTHLGMTHADLAASTLHRHDSVMARAKLDSSLRHARETATSKPSPRIRLRPCSPARLSVGSSSAEEGSTAPGWRIL